ncbi:hypothetical protein KUTeg_010269 [Tegillarca granosa]|uniref:Uncharacterized protein n=1 Tax=Tegillarca granosa TaxID=220873 RepID=A0ABQ9F9J8_TEGGR|nr:hypothetical protein KUTeg_010269 [Tegillarca granosa]
MSILFKQMTVYSEIFVNSIQCVDYNYDYVYCILQYCVFTDEAKFAQLSLVSIRVSNHKYT